MELTQRIVEARIGQRVDFNKVEAIPDLWQTTIRGECAPLYVATCRTKLRRFVNFMQQEHPESDELVKVRADHVKAFLDTETRRGVSARTYNIALRLLKAVFARFEPSADAYENELKNHAFKPETDAVHREPFTEEELAAILEAAKEDELLRGPIVVAVSTAMRRGDCCRLRWADVDLKGGFIKVKCSKTAEIAEIPILPALREELDRTPKTGSGFVFPAAAELYERSSNTLDAHLRALLARVGFVDPKPAVAKANGKPKEPKPRPDLPILPPEELRRRGLEAIAAGDMIEAKRERMKAVFTEYVDGVGLPTIARKLELSKSTVSLLLNEAERLTGAAVLRRPPPPTEPAVIRGPMKAENGHGKRLNRGTLRGWHSFRVAFVTRALAQGMAEEMVRRVSGHTAVDVVRTHYFRPGREEFRKAFELHMPQVLLNGAKSRDEQLVEIITGMTVRTLKRDKERALTLLKKAG